MDMTLNVLRGAREFITTPLRLTTRFVCVGFYGYDESVLDESYVANRIPKRRILYIDVSEVRTKNLAERYGGPLVFHGIVTRKGFTQIPEDVDAKPYVWEKRYFSGHIQNIIKNSLCAITTDDGVGRVFVDRSSISPAALNEIEKKLIPRMYKTAVDIKEKWRSEAERANRKQQERGQSKR